MAKVLLATEKPFAPAAVEGITKIFQEAGYELKLLEKYQNKSEFLEAAKDVDAMIVRSDIVDEDVIKAGNNLKIVVRAGAGYDNIDLKASSSKRIVVMNTPGQNSNAVAELAIGMMIYLNRNKFAGTAGTELRGKTIGIHGYGHIGRLIGSIAKGFGMTVHAHDPFIDKVNIEKDGVLYESDVKELYSKCQFISVNIPANAETTGFVNYDLLSLMPQGATVVNTARKEVIDEKSLVKIFEKRNDFRYISDIAPGVKDEIESRFGDRVFLTPKKMGAQTAEANINAGLAAAHQIVNYFKKDDTSFQVN